MSNDTLAKRILDDMKTAMRNKETLRLTTIRMLRAAIKTKEIDSQTTLDDTAIIGVIQTLIKQRKGSIADYEAAHRQDLADQEQKEIDILTAYLPIPLTEAEIDQQVAAAITQAGASSMKDMGKVMSQLNPILAGRADMSAVSQKVKSKLSASS